MEFVLDGQLGNRTVYEIGIEFIDHFKGRLNLGAIGAQRIDDRLRVLFGRRGDIENIPRLYAGPTIIIFLAMISGIVSSWVASPSMIACIAGDEVIACPMIKSISPTSLNANF